MMLSRSTTDTIAGGCGRMLLPVLLLAVGLASAVWHHAAWAGETTEAKEKVAGEPSFGLPPIVVQIPEAGHHQPKMVVLKVALVFDETDEDRINDSLRIAKILMPRIMDSVIAGVQEHHFDSASKAEDVNELILDRSAAVLRPYGVLVKSLRIEQLGDR
jgi:hypothetical protein